MSFLYPIFIYLMLPLMLVLFYLMATGSRRSLVHFDASVLQRLRLHSRGMSQNSRNILFFVSFVFMTLALAQPVIKEGEITVEAKSADILIAIDISDSMKAEDRYPNRLEFAKSKAIELIKQASHNRIGVLAFARHDYIVSPLSFDHASVAFLLSRLQTDNITEKGTHFDSMLHSAESMLSHAKKKNLLLFTDGGDSSDFSKEIGLAKEKDLRIFVIGIGSEQGSPVKSEAGSFVKHQGNILISKLNPEMKKLATQTGGVFIEAVLGDEDIKTMLEEIEAIAEKSSLKEEKIPRYTQLFYYPLALAVLFLLLAFSSLPRARNLLLLGLLLGSTENARADLLDFQTLQKAKEAYSQEQYEQSAALYEAFADKSSEAAYNYANSLYKAKAYEKAIEAYAKVESQTPELKAKALHNSGNAYAKLQQYQEALAAYEEALKLNEDKETKENYEAVKKLLQEQKKEQKDEKQKDEEDSKSEDEKKEETPQDEKKDQEGSKSEDEQKSDASQNEQKKSEKEEEKPEKGEAEGKKQEEQTQSEADSEEPEAQEGQKDDAQELPVNMKKMSDLEAQKWLKVLQASQKGHLYKMQEREHERDEDEKPW
ncbi:MAG: VWA domain-containing protein [Campylobacterales bacterium]|nr:VWA domain-containing protein [Campylobacterales bacterium]